jgi:hypothetical protein
MVLHHQTLEGEFSNLQKHYHVGPSTLCPHVSVRLLVCASNGNVRAVKEQIREEMGEGN